MHYSTYTKRPTTSCLDLTILQAAQYWNKTETYVEIPPLSTEIGPIASIEIDVNGQTNDGRTAERHTRKHHSFTAYY